MRRATTVIALLVTGLLSGCFVIGGTDDGAEKLKDTIATMPGVSYAGFSTDDARNRVLPHLFATMSAATHQEIRAVVDAVKNTPHEDVETLDIKVSEKPLISVSRTVADIDTDQFIDDVARLRRLVPHLGPEAVARWTRDDVPDGDLYLSRESPLPGTLALIRDNLGNIGLAQIYPGASSSVQRWRIYLPYSPDEERRVNAQLESLPVRVGAVTVSSGVITELTIAVTDSAAVEPALNAVITKLGAGPEAPLLVSWQVGQISLPAAPDGTVHVGACGYPTTPYGDSLTDQEKALQERLRGRFDTCPR